MKSTALKKKVTLLGNIDSPITFLKAIDIYTSFSKGEGSPYSVLEAMACNKPILLSNVLGHSNMLCEDHLFKTRSELIEKLSMNIDNTSLPKIYKISETTRKLRNYILISLSFLIKDNQSKWTLSLSFLE